MFPFYHNYPGTDLHEIDLAYILRLCAELRASNTTFTEWKNSHTIEYKELKKKVDALTESLIDVVVPWNNSIAYEIYSIVEYEGVNYIAVQDVPIGVMITNTDYWQPANTIVEQINAIGATTNEIKTNYLKLDNYQIEPEYLKKVVKTTWLESINDFDYATYNILQGGEYDSRRNRYVIAFTDTNYANGVLIAVNEELAEITHSAALPIGHANDIAYNPNDDCFYICSGETGTYANMVIKVSAETFAILDTFEFPDMTDAPWMIAYNTDLNRFYLVSDDEVMICDNLFNTLQRIETDIRDVYQGNTTMLKQSMFYYDGTVYVCNMIGAGTVNEYGNGVFLTMYDPNDFSYLGHINIKNLNARYEIEFIAMKENGIGFCLYGQQYLTSAYIRLNKNIVLNQSHSENISTAKLLPAGTDLNDVLLEGTYIVRNEDRTTILNPPSNEANTYTLVVEGVGYNGAIKQTAYYPSGSVYDRSFILGSRTWFNWGHQQALRKGNSFSLSGTCCAGYVFGNGTAAQFTIPVNTLLDENATYSFLANTTIVVRSIDGIKTTGGNNGQLISDFNPQITRHYSNLDVYMTGLPSITPNTPITVSFPGGQLVYG